ncbi:MAG: NFACT RNA binding domain-containing protein [Candidatus Anstonellales archaeon]
MKVVLSYKKSVHENAAYYYELAKKYRKKAHAAREALKELEKKLEEAKKKKEREKPTVRVLREKEWYEKFHWFFTSSGKLVIGGKDAQQNDLIYSKHIEPNDLFFHADIQGGSVVILKDGKNAGEQERLEAAQFAACFSKAWSSGFSYVDVYSAAPEQLTKHSAGEYVAKGAIVVRGEKEWYKRTPLKLRLGIDERGRVAVIPAFSKTKLKNEITIIPGKEEKGVVAKKLAKILNIHPDELLQILPSGKTSVVRE